MAKYDALESEAISGKVMKVCPNCGDQTIRGHYVSFGPGGSGLYVCSILKAYGERDDKGNPIGLASHFSGESERG